MTLISYSDRPVQHPDETGKHGTGSDASTFDHLDTRIRSHL